MATSDDLRIRISAQNDTRPALKQVKDDLQDTEAAARRTRQAVTGAGTSFGGMGRSAGQAGIQIQQFVGQVQGGTSPLLAFSQQAADLGIVLGAPLLGAVAALGASLGMVLIPTLFESEKAAGDFTEEIIKAAGGVDKLTESQRRLAVLDTEIKIRELREQLLEAEEAERKLNAQQEKREETSKGIGRTAKAAALAIENQGDVSIKASQDAELLRAKIDATSEALESLRAGVSDAPDTLRNDLDAMRKSFMSERQLIEAWQAEKLQLIDDAEATGAITAAQAQADREALMVEAFNRQLELENQYYLDQKRLKEQKERENAIAANKARIEAEKKAREEAQLTNKIDELRQSMMSEEQLIIDWQERKMALIDEYEAAGLAGEIEAQELREQVLQEAINREIDLERKKAEQLKKIREADQQSVKSTLWGNVAILEQAFGRQSALGKAAFVALQAKSAAEAIINGELAAMQAMTAFPPPVNAMYATMAKASGYAAAGAIMGQTLGSFEGGGYTGMGARTGGVDGKGGFHAILHPNETVIDHTKGGGAGVNVNFTIQANDTAGFDKLLESRRGQIVSLVSKALANNGRRL